MNQPYLFNFAQPETIPSPICCRQNLPCWKAGRAVLGPPMMTSEWGQHRDVLCITCGATGGQAKNLQLKTAAYARREQ